MNLAGATAINQVDELRKQYARVMNALIMAMDAAQNWQDTLDAADVMMTVTLTRFQPLLREAVSRASDGFVTEGASANP